VALLTLPGPGSVAQLLAAAGDDVTALARWLAENGKQMEALEPWTMAIFMVFCWLTKRLGNGIKLIME
jgi:hypothetical protein